MISRLPLIQPLIHTSRIVKVLQISIPNMPIHSESSDADRTDTSPYKQALRYISRVKTLTMYPLRRPAEGLVFDANALEA